MSKTNVTKFFNDLRRVVGKRSPEILTGIGIAGMITTTVLAVKATPKALTLIEDKKSRLNHELIKDASASGDDCYCQLTKLKPIEMVKVAWKQYVPAAIIGIASISCLVGASSVNLRRNAALATAYKLSETALTEYKAKVVETIGEKKERSVRDKVAQDKLDKNPWSNNQVIITDKGNTLCYDGVSGRYFKSDIETIRRAINTINRSMTYDMYVSLSEFYDELGLEHTDVSDDLGWNLDNGLVDIDFDSRIAEDGTPCITLNYRVSPRYDFSSLM